MDQQDPAAHLHPHLVAGFLDGSLDASERAGAAEHLAGCRECRDELADVSRILTKQRPRRLRWMVPAAGAAAAAAAVIVVLVGPRMLGPSGDQDRTRDPALTTTMAPQPIEPLGSVTRSDSIRWSSVPGALRYRLTVFAADGEVVWQTTPPDTAIGVPDSLDLETSAQYYWQVKAETGHGRWVESELVPFVVLPQGPTP